MSELNCHAKKFFTENLSTLEMTKTQIYLNKSVYLKLSILELNENSV